VSFRGFRGYEKNTGAQPESDTLLGTGKEVFDAENGAQAYL
jgi:hypothetical protein